MTVSTTHAVKQYNGAGGGADTFPVDFQFFDDIDLKVILINALGAEFLQTIAVNYDVAGGKDENGQPNTGSVVMVIPPAIGEKLRIERVTPFVQQIDFNLGSNFNPETVEAMGDRDRVIDQEVALRGGLRDVKLSLFDYLAGFNPELPSAVPSKFIRINPAGTGFALTSGLTWRGPWALSTPYAVDELVQNVGSSWMCKQAHTASADKEPGVGGSYATFWDLAAQKGDTGATGAAGLDGLDAGLPWNFDSSTAMADPGAGDIRLNNATLASVTALAVSYNDAEAGNPSVANWVKAWDDSTNPGVLGTIIIKDRSTPASFAIYNVTAALTDNTTWAEVPVAHVSSNGTLSGLLSVQFARVGDTATATIADNSVTNAKLADMAQNTIKGRITASTGDPEDLTPAQARIVAGLDQITTRGDANYTILATDRHVHVTAALTAPRTFTLPAASAVNPGHRVWVMDQLGTAFTATNSLTIAAAGADTIEGAASVVLTTSPTGVELVSDGTSKWSGQVLFFGANPILNRFGTAQGSILYRGSAGWLALAPGTAGNPLVTGGAGADPSFAQLGTTGIANDAVTYAKIQNVSATDRLLGRDTAAAGDIEELTATGGIEFTGTGIQTSAFTGDVTKAAGGTALTIANDAVTFAKFQNITDARLLGRNAGSNGDMQEITLGTNLSFSGTTLNAGGGTQKYVNRAFATYTTNANLTTTIPFDDTIPTSSEGTEIVTASITPASASNRVRVVFRGIVSHAPGCCVASKIAVTLFQDAGAAAIAVGTGVSSTAQPTPIELTHEFVPGTTSSITMRIRAGGSAGTIRFNGTTAARLFGGISAATLILEEITP